MVWSMPHVHRSTASQLSLLLLAVMAVACGEDAPPALPGQTIGPAGGTVTSSDGRFTVVVPPGALADERTLEISAAGERAPGQIGPGFRLGPGDLTFRKPLTLRLRVEPGELAGTTVSSLHLVS